MTTIMTLIMFPWNTRTVKTDRVVQKLPTYKRAQNFPHPITPKMCLSQYSPTNPQDSERKSKNLNLKH